MPLRGRGVVLLGVWTCVFLQAWLEVFWGFGGCGILGSAEAQGLGVSGAPSKP